MPSPDRDGLAEQAFLQAVAAGNSFIPLWKRWPADLETPLTTWLKVGAGSEHGVLLESVEGGERIGRWSFVVSDPLWTLTSRGEQSERRWRDGRCEPLEGNPFSLLRECLEPLSSTPIPGLPPVGQLFGFWGYELIRWIEPSVPVHPPGEGAPPDGCWMLADSLLVFDQVKRQITAVAYADLSDGQEPHTAYAAAAARIAALEERMHAPLPGHVTPLRWHDASAVDMAQNLVTSSNVGREAFEAAVLRGEEHIEAGDVFQLVLSQRLETRIDRDPFELYRSLRMVNPSPYMAFFNFGGWYLIGSSPEVIDVSSDHNHRLRGLVRGSQDPQHIGPGPLDRLHLDGGPDFHFRKNKPHHHLPSIEFALEVSEFILRFFKPFLSNRVADADGGDAGS